jgi:hypothetical protein
MDHGESAIRKLIAGAWLAGAAAMALAVAPPLFETLRWTAPGAELAALSSQPSACLAFDPKNAPMVQAGQALFNTPTLLGGQAAKAGLNCASCHVNGRDNPHFILSGISEKAGTSDVTNSFFSAARSNGRFDPVTIPDLAAAGKISRDPDAKTLEPFIRTLIVEEFGGQEPTPAMLEALSSYVRAIQKCQGSEAVQVARTLDDQLILINAALIGASEMAKSGNDQAAKTLVAAARHQLGLVSERYAGNDLAKERESLLTASRQLQVIGEMISQKTAFTDALATWKADFDSGLVAQLRRKTDISLYNPRLLAEHLKK